MPGLSQTLAVMTADGTALANSTTETSILIAGEKMFLPSNLLWTPGKRLRVTAAGRISNIVTTPGTLTFRFKLGASATIAVATSRAIALNTTAKTNVGWWLDLELVLRSAGGGTSSNFMAMGAFDSESVVGAAAGVANTVTWQDAPAVGTGFDKSVANQIDLTAAWSIANAGNSIQCHMFALEDLTAAA